MVKYETFQSMVMSLISHNSKVTDFENGLEKLLGSDSTVMCCWMNDAPYEMLQALIVTECGESSDGWNWFEEHLEDFVNGTGSRIAIRSGVLEGEWKEYDVKTLHDYYLYLKGELKPARTYTDDGMVKEAHHVVSFGPNGVEILDA